MTPLAAVGIVLLTGGAAATHLRRHEPQLVAVNGILLILAAAVAVGNRHTEAVENTMSRVRA